MSKKNSGGLFAMIIKPTFHQIVKSHKNYKRNYYSALQYAHYELTANDLKKEVLKYLKTIDASLYDRAKNLHENRFVVVGKYVYILNHGGELPENVAPTVIPAIEKILNEEEAKKGSQIKDANILQETTASGTEISDSTKTSLNIQDRLREKAKEIASEVEGWIDEFVLNKKSQIKNVEDFVGLFKSNDLKGPHMRYIQQSFSSRLSYIESVIESKDKDINEGYSNFTKPELKKFLQLYQNLIKATEMLQDAAKVVRAPRKPKPVSQEKLVSKLKYKKEDTALGIVSLNPIQILGAKEVWIYNTKTRKLSQYRATDERGLTVKGASIENFTTDSVEKTLRRPADSLTEFKKASKVKLRTFMKDISTVDTMCTGKLNEHCVILRVDK